MSFEWLRFLELAEALANTTPPDEAAFRSAISRAYYAAFHHARIYLWTQDSSLGLRDGNAHQQVPEHLKAPGRTRVEKGAAARLEALRRLRNWADYEPTLKTRLDSVVEQALRDATAVVTTLGSATSPQH